MPIILSSKPIKHTLEDFNKVLSEGPLTTVHLWFKALANSSKSEYEIKQKLVDYYNNLLEKENIQPGTLRPTFLLQLGAYHILFNILFEWCVRHEWENLLAVLGQKRKTFSKEDKEGLDKSMMWFYHDFVIKRDKCKCQICGTAVTLKTAHVHHIWQRYNSKREIIGPSTLFNLITLCRRCHEKLHPWMQSDSLLSD